MDANNEVVRLKARLVAQGVLRKAQALIFNALFSKISYNFPIIPVIGRTKSSIFAVHS